MYRRKDKWMERDWEKKRIRGVVLNFIQTFVPTFVCCDHSLVIIINVTPGLRIAIICMKWTFGRFEFKLTFFHGNKPSRKNASCISSCKNIVTEVIAVDIIDQYRWRSKEFIASCVGDYCNKCTRIPVLVRPECPFCSWYRVSIYC